MQKFATLALAALVLAPVASAQMRPEVAVGYDADREAMHIGVGARTPFANLPLTLAPHVDYYFIDNTTALQGNVDGIYSFPGTSFSPYIGAGLALAYTNVGKTTTGNTTVDPDAETEVGFNLLVGATMNRMVAIQPYVQARLTAATSTGGVGVAVGLIF